MRLHKVAAAGGPNRYNWVWIVLQLDVHRSLASFTGVAHRSGAMRWAPAAARVPLLLVLFLNDATGHSNEFCSEAACEYHFHYQKVLFLFSDFPFSSQVS